MVHAKLHGKAEKQDLDVQHSIILGNNDDISCGTLDGRGARSVLHFFSRWTIESG